MATSVVFPRVQFFANNGRPLIGGRVHTYVAGSSTRARTYKDAAKAQPNANPIILDARGEASVYLAEGVEYKFVIEDSTGALIMTQEPVYGAVWPNAAEWPSDATLSYQYMTEAKAMADAVSVAAFYDTYAQAAAALPGLVNGDIIEVSRDETRASARVRYKVQAGALVFVVNLDQLRVDLAASSGASKVGYMPTGVGAVATTVEEKLRKSPDAAGGFWPDGSPAGVIQRLYDRVFIGGAAQADGTLANVAKDWLETERPYTTRNSQMAVTSTIGQGALLGGSRTSDSADSGSMGCIGGNFFAINNNSVQVQSAYAGYFEARRKAGAGVTHGIEIDVVNQGSGVTVHPYTIAPLGMTNGLWLASGGEVAGANPASIGLGIINNGASFDKGILFQNNAITGTNGVTGTGTAIGMAKGHLLTWYNPTGAPASYIYSDASSSTMGAGLLLTDGSARIINSPTGAAQFEAAFAAGNANYIGVLASNAGDGAVIRSLGTDENIDIRIAPKGSGVLAVTYGSTPATEPSSFSATRRLAFKDGNNVTWYIPISTVAW